MALAQVSEKEGDGGPQTGKHEGVLETEAEGRGHAGGQADLTRGGPCCFRRSRKKQGAVSTAVSRGRRSLTFRRTVGVGIFGESRAQFMPKLTETCASSFRMKPKAPGEGDRGWRLNRCRYGVRDASHNWVGDWQKQGVPGGNAH